MDVLETTPRQALKRHKHTHAHTHTHILLSLLRPSKNTLLLFGPWHERERERDTWVGGECSRYMSVDVWKIPNSTLCQSVASWLVGQEPLHFPLELSFWGWALPPLPVDVSVWTLAVLGSNCKTTTTTTTTTSVLLVLFCSMLWEVIHWLQLGRIANTFDEDGRERRGCGVTHHSPPCSGSANSWSESFLSSNLFVVQTSSHVGKKKSKSSLVSPPLWHSGSWCFANCADWS